MQSKCDCEIAASQAAGQSDGGGRVLGTDGSCFKHEQMALERTCRRIPAILRWDDSEVGGRSAVRTDPQQDGTSGVITSVHGSRVESAQVEMSPEGK